MRSTHNGLTSLPITDKQRQLLRARRDWLGLTQRALGKRVGCSGATILRLEMGTAGTSPELLSKICSALGMKWDVEVRVKLVPVKKRKR